MYFQKASLKYLYCVTLKLPLQIEIEIIEKIKKKKFDFTSFDFTKAFTCKYIGY